MIGHTMYVTAATVVVCIALGLALAVIAHNQPCIERRVGYCPPDTSVVITCPTCRAAAVGI